MVSNPPPVPVAPRITTPQRDAVRVLMVTDSEQPSGVGTHMLTLARALPEAIDPVLVFVPGAGLTGWAHRAMAAGIRASSLPLGALTGGTAPFIAMLREFRPHLVHVHAGIGWEGHALVRAAREAGVGAVVRTEHLPYTLHALRQPALERDYARGAALADRIVCVSDAARMTFRMSGLEPSRFATIHNGIIPVPARLPPQAVRRKLGVGKEKLLLTVGRLTEQKRHAVLLAAFRPVLRAHPDARLLIVGSGPLDAPLQRLAARLELNGNVDFLGARDDVPDLLAAADVFCLPSYFEGHPLVLMEAMSAGLPIVAARSLGITEVVDNGETGVLVPVDDEVSLGAALCRLLSDPPLAQRLADRGRRVASGRFGAARMAARMQALYRDVLSARGLRKAAC